MKNNPRLYAFYLVAVFALIVPPACYISEFGTVWSDETKVWADFGSFLAGTVAVLLSGLGLVALLMTLRLQQKQFEQFASDAKRKSAEDHLFQMLSYLSEILGDTDLRSGVRNTIVVTGRDAYKNFYRKKLRAIYRAQSAGSANHGLDERVIVRNSFDDLYRRYGSDFGHYFRTLYRCILLIDGEEFDGEDRSKYVSLIMCRLSKFEILLLMYNCLGSIGEVKFKEKVEKYGLLEHLDKSLVLDRSHLKMFSERAFKME